MISSTSNHRDFSSQRSSRPEVFYKKGVLNNFQKFNGKHFCRSIFLIEVASLTLLKTTPAQVIFCKFCNILNRISSVKQIRTASSEHS